jgi:RNA polymerase sigma-70 factor (ECF subfamily)
LASERTDEELLLALAGEDLAALDTLYARYGGLAFSLALRITRDREVAEEVVQEAFLSIWRRSATYCESRGGARSWLLSIVHHRAIDAVRARSARGFSVPLDDELPLASADDPESEVVRTLDREAIQKALASLPDEQRRCIVLAYFGGLTYPEIAERLGVPLGTVKSRLRLALEKLRPLVLTLASQSETS